MNKTESIDIFKEYVKNYDLGVSEIRMKQEHSIRVMKIASILAKEIGLSDNDTDICTLAGLLHDYARFEQWQKYNTFWDYLSFDHGDRAVEILFENNEIDKYDIQKENYSKIKDAIKYHNKFQVPDNLTEENKVICKIIRDADKIDIFYLAGLENNDIAEDTLNISKEIEEQFYQYSIISNEKVKNENDKTLQFISWIFDINFDSSLEYLIQYGYLDRFFDTIINKEIFEPYIKISKEYINKRLNI